VIGNMRSRTPVWGRSVHSCEIKVWRDITYKLVSGLRSPDWLQTSFLVPRELYTAVPFTVQLGAGLGYQADIGKYFKLPLFSPYLAKYEGNLI
jgi:hypothetical protein